jgi:hypothetical protein
LIVEANLHADPRRIEKLVDLFLPLYRAWRQVEQDAYAGKLQFADDSSQPQKSPAGQAVRADESSGDADLDTPRIRCNA